MVETILLKLGLAILAVACFVFGGLTARKGFTSVREGRIDEKYDGPMAEHYGLEALGLGAFVFSFGFALLYVLMLF